MKEELQSFSTNPVHAHFLPLFCFPLSIPIQVGEGGTIVAVAQSLLTSISQLSPFFHGQVCPAATARVTGRKEGRRKEEEGGTEGRRDRYIVPTLACSTACWSGPVSISRQRCIFPFFFELGLTYLLLKGAW